MVPPRTRADKGKAPAVESAPPLPPRGRARRPGITIEERHLRAGMVGQEFLPYPSQTEEVVFEDPVEDQEPVEAEAEVPTEAARSGPSRRQSSPDPQMQAVMGVLSGIAQTMERIMDRLDARDQPQQAAPRDRSADPVASAAPAREFEPRVASAGPSRQSPAAAPDRFRPVEVCQGGAPAQRRALPEPIGRGLDMRTFQHFRPPTFGGEHDYTVVDSWVFGMEQVFEYMACQDELKVSYATYMLQGPAMSWWRSERQTVPSGWRTLTLEQFLDRFTRHYIRTSEHSR